MGMMFVLASQEIIGLREFKMSYSPSTNCSNASWRSMWHNGSNAHPVNGDYIYSSNDDTDIYTAGGSQYFMSQTMSATNKASIQIVPQGMVVSRLECP